MARILRELLAVALFKRVAMWSAWFKRLETLFVAVSFAEAGEFETAREIAYGTPSATDVRSQA